MKAPDAMARKRSQRRGRERGCWVYIAGEVLAAAGIDHAFIHAHPRLASERGRLAGSAS